MFAPRPGSPDSQDRMCVARSADIVARRGKEVVRYALRVATNTESGSDKLSAFGREVASPSSLPAQKLGG